MSMFRNYLVDLLRYMPEHLTKDREIVTLLLVESAEHNLQEDILREIFQQFFVETATWGLAKYENDYGLVANPGDTYQQRRNRIYLKLQSKQTSTKKFMTKLSARYYPPGTNVKITEHNNEYYFDIKGDKLPLDIDGLFDALEMYKPAHLGLYMTFELTKQTKLYMGGMLTDINISGIDMAPLPDLAKVPLFVGALTDDTPDGIAPGMLIRENLPEFLGIIQNAALIKRIGAANFTPVEPWDLQIAFNQYHGGFFDGDDIYSISSHYTPDVLHSGNYVGSVLFSGEGRITPSVSCPDDLNIKYAVLFTPKLKRITCDMSDLDKMAEAPYLPPTGCTSANLNIAAFTEFAADSIAPRRALREAIEPAYIGAILQTVCCRIGAQKSRNERKDEQNEHI